MAMLGWVLKLLMVTFSTNFLPTFITEPFNYAFTIHFSIIHTNTHFTIRITSCVTIARKRRVLDSLRYASAACAQGDLIA